jgi:hypothetical protein
MGGNLGNVVHLGALLIGTPDTAGPAA